MALGEQVQRWIINGENSCALRKSQLAIEYAHWVRGNSPNTYVFWLHAGSVARLEKDIRSTLEQLEEPGLSNSQANVFKLFRTWLLGGGQRRQWLIVLDNADDSRFLVKPPTSARSAGSQDDGKQAQDLDSCLDYFPCSAHGSMLITSRSKAAVSEIVDRDEIIEVLPMDEEHALALLRKKLGSGIPHTREELINLSTELDCMPLPMAQAAAYIRARYPRCSVREYLTKLRADGDSRLSLLSQSSKDHRRDQEAENCILRTWTISFEHIREMHKTAADLLSLMSFFDRQSVPESLLYDVRLGSSEDMDSDNVIDTANTSTPGPKPGTFDDDILVLQDYSFVSVTTDVSSFEMHRLVQDATQNWVKANGQYERWLMQFLSNLENGFPDSQEDAFFGRGSRLFPHTVVAMEANPNERGALLRLASLLLKSGRYASMVGAECDAEKMRLHSSKLRADLLGTDDVETLTSKLHLAITWTQLGRYKEAEDLEREVYHHTQRLFGEQDTRMLDVMAGLADICLETGRLKESEDIVLRANGICETHFGHYYFRTLQMKHFLGNIYRSQQRYGDAKEMLEQALGIARALYHAEHPLYLDILHDRAATLEHEVRYDEARQLLEQVLQKEIQVLGDDHINTLNCSSDLSITLRKLGRRRSARKLLRDCVNKTVSKLGPDHPKTVKRQQMLEEWEAEDGSDTEASKELKDEWEIISLEEDTKVGGSRCE